MKSLGLSRWALCIGAALAVLSGCGVPGPAQDGMQPPIGETGRLPQTIRDASSSFRVLLRLGPAHEISSPLLNVNGVLYGTTHLNFYGGCHHQSLCHGTVFTISKRGVKKVLYNFKGGVSDGAQPVGPLIAVNGTLYGTTTEGGGTGCASEGCGTVYSITTSGSEKMLYAFQGGSDGANPTTALVDVNGTLYGTTLLGGNNMNCDGQDTGCGTVYSISTSGSETVLYRFISKSGGWLPDSALIDVKGLLYGTTSIGGVKCGSKTEFVPQGCGTVYSITTSGSETVLHRFRGPNLLVAEPTGGLLNVRGTLYGMTNDYASPGAVYKIRLADNRYKVIYRFEGQPDGLLPAGVLIKVKGLLYGVTQGGGTGCSGGCGTVFSITTSGTETVVYSFGGQPNGAYPRTGLTAVHSTFYGTTSSGGDPGCNYGCGTIFALSL